MENSKYYYGKFFRYRNARYFWGFKVGRLLLALRNLMNLSRAKMAEKIGISEDMYIKHEKDYSAIPEGVLESFLKREKITKEKFLNADFSEYSF